MPAMPGSLTAVTGIGPETARRLIAAGFATVESVAAADAEDLVGVKGIGPLRAAALQAAARAAPAGGDPAPIAEPATRTEDTARRVRKLRKKANDLRADADRMTKKAKAAGSKKQRKRRRREAEELRAKAKEALRDAKRLLATQQDAHTSR
jgi:Holliday junction resolvasome RuvABC DNA-binding subunit